MPTDQNGVPQPGEEHELLKPFAGVFKAKVTIYMGEQEVVTTGTMTSEFVLGGLYLSQKYVGDPNDGPFPAFEGMGFWGYNQASELYEGFWVDNASSIMQREDGTVDETGKVWEMLSEVEHPQMGLMEKRSEIRLINDDRHEVEAFMSTDDNPEVKIMEIEYERV